MKNNSLLTKERIIIFLIGIIVLAGGMVYRFSSEIDFFSASDKMDTLAKYQKRSLKLAALEDRNIFLTSHVERISAFLISAGSGELAGAKIQEMLRDMAAQEKISLNSIKSLKPDEKTYNYLSIIPVKLTFKAKIRQLEELLFRIETSSKMLDVSELRTIKPSGKETEELNIIMVVQGFLAKQG